MKATITSRESSRRGEILKALIDQLQGDAGLQANVVANGIGFEGLARPQVSMVREVLTQQFNYTAYTSTDSSVRLLAADNDFMPLLRMLVRLLPAQNPVSQSLWNAGITFDNLSPDQANGLQTALIAAGAQVALSDAPANRQVTGQISWSDGRPWQEGGHLVQADDVVSATNSLPLAPPSAPSRDGRYTIPYTWTSTDRRNGPNLRLRLLNPEGAVVAEAKKPSANRQEVLDLQVNIPAPPQSYTLRGTVLDAASDKPLFDAQVVVLFQSGSETLGRETASTLSTGEFSVPLNSNLWAGRPSGQPVAVSFEVSHNGQSLATDTRISDLQPQDQAITVRVTVPTAEPEDPFIVQGTITLADGIVLQGVLVRAFDCDMSSEELLGEQVTNAQGFYSLSYTPAQFRRAEKSNADLVVRVYGESDDPASGNLAELAASEILFKAPPVATIDVPVPAAAYRGPSEWERHHAAILPLRVARDGVTLVEVTALTDDNLNFLAPEAEIPIEHLRHLRQDAQWAEAHDVTEAVFYGLLRQGLPTELRSLLAEPPSRQHEALKAALAENQIPQSIADDLDGILERLLDVAVQMDFVPDEDSEAPPPLGQLLSTTTLDQTTLESLARFIRSYEGQTSLWDALTTEANFSTAALDEVRFTLETSPLLLDHVPTLRMVQRLKREQNWHSAQDLARFTREQWQTLLTEIPTGDLPTAVQTPDVFADAIASRVEQAYPTAVIAQRLANDTSLSTPDLNAFFADNPGFELLSTSIDRYLSNGAQLEQIANTTELNQQLKQLQRLARITPDRQRFELMGALRQSGYTSAMAIANTNPETFIGQIEAITGQDTARQVYDTALQKHDQAQMTVLMLSDLIIDQPRVIPGLHDPLRFPSELLNPSDPTPPDSSSELPNWVQLFGSLSGCACRHCRSVYSPAAYLVDLLQFLRKAPRGGLLRGELTRRRPDIRQLLLNCENANTPLPYIDLVNEVLERQVLVQQDPPSVDADRFFQTEGSTELDKARLRARPDPDHESAAAYNILASIRYPWLLPFDINHEKMLAWADQLDLDLPALQTLFGQTVDETARLFLRLSPANWQLITQSEVDPRNLAALLGNLDLGQTEFAVPDLLQRTGLNYNELVELLASQFMARYELRLDTAIAPCTIERHTLSRPSDPALDLLHRFIRLDRALGWSIRQLDGVLTALGRTDLDGPTLVLLADTWKLAQRFRLSVEETAEWVNAEEARLQAELAQWLRVSERDLLRFESLVGDIDWAASDNRAANVLSLLDRWQVWEQSGVDLYELAYLLRHEDLTPAVFEPLPATVDSYLRSLHAAAQTVRDRSVAAAESLLAPLQRALVLAEEIQASPLPVHLNDEEQVLEQNRRNRAVETARARVAATELEIETALQQELEAVIVAQIAQVLDSSPETVSRVLGSNAGGNPAALLHATADLRQPAINDWLAFVQIVPPSEPDLASAQIRWLRLDKTLRLLQGLQLTPSELAALQATPTTEQRLDFNSLPTSSTDAAASYQPWENLARLKQLSAKLPPADLSLFDVLQRTHAVGANRVALLADLRSVTAWDIEPRTGELQSIIAPLVEALWPGDDVTPFQQVQTYERLYQAGQWVRRYRITAETLVLWGTSDLTVRPDDASSLPMTSDALLASLEDTSRQRYPNDISWYQAITPAMDRLRLQKRDALVAYLLANPIYLTDADTDRPPTPVWQSTADLYGYFLIDVEMSACQLSSRIVQATNAIQHFVQRLRMSLEPTVMLGDQTTSTHWQQWEWIKNYRVWEANRKVFLHPENWIEPDLRDNKSPFFIELESTLLQGEINERNVEQAYRNYFAQLSDVARLDVRGLYEEELPDNGGKVLHVFARTYSEPHNYYYRKRLPSRVWTAWESVEIGITGNHLIPVVRNGQLMLFWATFQEEANTDERGAVSSRFWNLQMHWSLYRDGQWQAQKTKRSPYSMSIEVPFGQKTIVEKHISFRVRNEDDRLDIIVFFDSQWLRVRRNSSLASQLVKRLISIASFSLDICKQELMLTPHNDIVHLPAYISRLRMDSIHQGYQNRGVFTSSHFGIDTGYRGWQSTESPTLASIWKDKLLTYDELRSIESQLRGFNPGWSGYIPILQDFASPYQSRTYLLGPSQDTIFNPFVRPFYLEHQDDNRAYIVSPKAEVEFIELRNPDSSHDLSIGGIGLVGGIGINNEMQRRIRGGVDWSSTFRTRTIYRFHFETFYHPFLCDMLVRFNERGLPGLLKAPVTDNLLHRQRHREGQQYTRFGEIRQGIRNPTRFERYRPTTEHVWRNSSDSHSLYPYEEYDFSEDGAYSLYNWELFFHIPLLVADRLSKNQRFEEAQKWFHYIFDPTDFSSHPAPAKYWKIKPFYELALQWSSDRPPETLEEMLRRLIANSDEFSRQVNAWRNDPFNPHLIARMRLIAYMKTVVQKYLDNLIDWGDSLFRLDTMESINEATQVFMLAAEILGPRPITIKREETTPRTYAHLEDSLDEFSNVLVQLENTDLAVPTPARPRTLEAAQSPQLALYFCLPFNEKLRSYWDTVADRLFKIRNCMNIDGQVRQLALFAPPIDPALLVRARAMGLDLGTVLSGELNAGVPHYRYSYLAQKATELCNDIKAMGSALLSTLEKQDAEALALLRSHHEVAMVQRLTDIKDLQIKESEETLRGLQASRLVVEKRQEYYLNLLSDGLISNERMQLEDLKAAKEAEKKAKNWSNAASGLAKIPEFKTGFLTTAGASFGGKQLSTFAKFMSALNSYVAARRSFQANMNAIRGGHARRQEEWDFQARLTERELAQIDRQILAAEIRLDIARKDKDNHIQQVRQAEDVERFMRSKYTNVQLYSWMGAQISALYYQSYKQAFDLAKKAEQAARFELGMLGLRAAEFSYIQFGHWDSQKKGLLAGERLQHDLRRMEMAYLDRHQREFELTKHISLLQLNPYALIALKETGQCDIQLPETLFDLDYPGHYLRRIKSVSLSIPCVVGPYTSVNGKLTLLSSKIRISDNPAEPYAHNDRFSPPDFIPTQSIATSSAHNDSGLFELNFRDERYLPFEGAGAISDWQLDLSGKWQLDTGELVEFPQFDFDTITDVILHLRYTARDDRDGGALKRAAIGHLQTQLDSEAGEQGLFRLFSLRHEFPTEWHRFLQSGDTTFTVTLTQQHFPFMFQSSRAAIAILEASLHIAGRETPTTLNSPQAVPPVEPSQALNRSWSVEIPRIALSLGDDAFLVCRYTVTLTPAPRPPAP
jgi:hypothetical protein